MFQTARSTTKTGRHSQETDPSRRYALKQCCDLLLAGGYFRVRMPTLSPFDKVVGGIAWSITASNIDVDVDLLFEENSSIGERIRVSESIVKSLHVMKCPYQLQSFQIQGLDYDNILPVLRWLIKQVIQTRQLTGDTTRIISLQKYHTYEQQHNDIYTHDDDHSNDMTSSTSTFVQQQRQHVFPHDIYVDIATPSVSRLIAGYHNQRRFKKRSDMVFSTEYERVESTLLEYQDRSILQRVNIDMEQHDIEQNKIAQKNQNNKHTSTSNTTDYDDVFNTHNTTNEFIPAELLNEDKRIRMENEMRLRSLETQLDQDNTTLNTLNLDDEHATHMLNKLSYLTNNNNISSSTSLDKAKDAYTSSLNSVITLRDQIQMETNKHNKLCDNMNKKINDLQNNIDVQKETYNTVLLSYNEIKNHVNEQQNKKLKLEESIADMTRIEELPENKQYVSTLKQLVILNEQLKRQESEFKSSCKIQLKLIKDKIEQLILEQSGSDILSRITSLEGVLAKEEARYNKTTSALDDANLALLQVYDKIDQVPTRDELLQFERRFLELYHIAARKLTETRGYFAWYNVLSATYGYLQQELTLLESVLNNFNIALKSEQAKHAMGIQMMTMVESVDESVLETKNDLDAAITEENTASLEYTNILNVQREYTQLLKVFQNECDLNTQYIAFIQQNNIQYE